MKGRSTYLVLLSIFSTCCWWLTAISYCPAQSTRFKIEHLSNEKLNVGGNVNHIHQDQYGFIWIGMGGGLMRYDGHEYRHFTFQLGDSTALPGSNVVFLREDAQHRLWALGSHFLVRFNRSNKTFDRPSNLFKQKINFPFGRYFSDKSGNIWSLYGEGITCFDPVAGTMKLFSEGLPGRAPFDKFINHIFFDRQGKMWLTSGADLYRIQNMDLGKLNLAKIEWCLENRKPIITALYESQQGRFYIGTNEGVWVSESMEGQFRPSEKINNLLGANLKIVDISEDQSGHLWIASEHTILIYGLNSEKHLLLEHKPHDANSLMPGKIRRLFHDRSGAHWAMMDGGLASIITLEKSSFNYLRHDPTDPNSLADGNVLSIYEEKNNVFWIGTYRGLTKWDRRRTGTFQRYAQKPPATSSIPVQPFASVMGNGEGELWLGTAHQGLFRMNIQTGKYFNYRSDPTDNYSLGSDDRLRVLHMDKKGNLWVARMDGLSVWHPATDNFTNIELFPGEPLTAGTHMFAIEPDTSDNVWVSGGNRLFKLTTSGQVMETIYPSFIVHNIYTLYHQPNKNILWIGAQMEGLTSFDLNTQKITNTYTMADGLPSNTIYGILEDEDGSLWMSTGIGISHFNPDDRTFENYNQDDGLGFDDFVTNAYTKANNGEMFFGGNELVYFHPDSIRKSVDSYRPPVYITGIKIMGEEMRPNSPIFVTEEIELTTDENFIEISFSSLDYKFKKNRFFKYKLENIETKWSLPTKRHFVQYKNIPIGEYIFRLKGTNNSGIWNEDEKILRIKVNPANFWEYQWFRPLFIFIFLTVLLFAVNFHHKKESKKRIRQEAAKQKRKIEQLQKEAAELTLLQLRNQMNPHFLFNALNTSNRFYSKDDLNSANKILASVGKLMRYLLDNSENLEVPMSEEIQFLKLYLQTEHIRHNGQFEFDFYIDPAINIESTLMPTMLVQPFVENAIQHGLSKNQSNGRIDINFQKESDKIICEILDNGVGINQSESIKSKYQKQRPSTAINNIRRRVGIMKGLFGKSIFLHIIDRKNIDESLNGTLVKITFPINHKKS